MMTRENAATLIRGIVAASDIDALDRFMAAHAVGTIAEHLVDQMIAPGQRAAWARNMREKYPADFGTPSTRPTKS